MERIQEMPHYIGEFVKGLPGAGLNFGKTDSTLSYGGYDVPITILKAAISRRGGERGYVVLAEKILGDDGEFNLVVKAPDGHAYAFATPGFVELTGLPPDVVCGRTGEFRRGLLEDIYNAAQDKSLHGRRVINLIQAATPTLARLPFPYA